VIGGGLTGIAVAWYLTKHHKKVTPIDKNNCLGGCHRVLRRDSNAKNPDTFTEHSPRVYVNAFIISRKC
jgi:protoporphyrinogen oxidase